jgi:hypothetical protein
MNRHRDQSVRDEKKGRNAEAWRLIVARVLCNLMLSTATFTTPVIVYFDHNKAIILLQ